jgi:hypothetical protein
MLFLVVMCTLSPLAAARPDSDAVRVTLTLRPLNPSVRDVDVEEDAGTAVFAGVVEVSKPPVGVVTVELDGNCDTGWIVIVSPQTIQFTHSGSEEYLATVTVPAGTPASMVGTVSVVAMARYPGSVQTSVTTASVRVNKYFGGYVSADPSKGTDNPQTFNLMVSNTGNDVDTLRLSIVDLAEHEKQGFEFDLKTSRINDIGPGDNVSVELIVSYGMKAKSGKHVFDIRVTSAGAEKCETEPFHWDSPVIIMVDNFAGGGGTSYSVMGGAIMAIVLLVAILVKARGLPIRLVRRQREVSEQ